ncbi:MAG: helix-turn-helix domain-containing protein [Bacteroidota bacterium]
MVKKAFGDKLRSVRKQLGLSQGDFANMLSINQSSVSKMERGSIEIPIKLIDEIFSRFQIEPRWFFFGDVAPNTTDANAQVTNDSDTNYQSEEIERLVKENKTLREKQRRLDNVLLSQGKTISKQDKEIELLVARISKLEDDLENK